MKNRPSLHIARFRLAITAFALLGVFLSHPDHASAQGCGGGPLSTSTGNLVGSAVGGAAGGLVGNQFGSGTGKGVMTGLGVDGRGGPGTSSALRSFQRGNGMASTGQLDVPTRTALGLDPAPLAEPVAQGNQPVQAGAQQRAVTPAAAAPSPVGE